MEAEVKSTNIYIVRDIRTIKKNPVKNISSFMVICDGDSESDKTTASDAYHKL